jgi:acyl-CoA thioester hydrolase
VTSSPARIHRLPVRVYYEDTDSGGVVYHANYLKFAERARTELLREIGLDHPTLQQQHGIGFAVRQCTLACLVPGRLDDRLEVETEIVRQGGASLTFRQRIVRNTNVVADVEIRVALVGPRDRPARMPAALKAAFAGWAAGDEGAKDG